MAFDQSPIRIGIALVTLTNVLDIRNRFDILLHADGQTPDQAPDPTKPPSQDRLDPDTGKPVWINRTAHIYRIRCHFRFVNLISEGFCPGIRFFTRARASQLFSSC
jgi:hypothetical protein